MITITLQQLIEREIAKAGSARQLGLKSHINHETINSMRNEANYKPSIETLIKLAKYTGFDLTTLVALAYPDAASESRAGAETHIMAQKFASLPPEVQSAIWMIMKNE